MSPQELKALGDAAALARKKYETAVEQHTVAAQKEAEQAERQRLAKEAERARLEHVARVAQEKRNLASRLVADARDALVRAHRALAEERSKPEADPVEVSALEAQLEQAKADFENLDRLDIEAVSASFIAARALEAGVGKDVPRAVWPMSSRLEDWQRQAAQ